ncbi:MFS transporter [Sphingomonas sp. PAMC 26617]|uniref:MFS transporter n=1 Tax=Sphingomonas sp. PAMC 26617 TaxID=1112216 RepID=UPI000288B7B9|nr:MFS transporter [Sphingomonas sp. PAMC 26617]
MAALMLSVFTVSLGFGIVLPSLPFLLERLFGAGGDARQISRATGLLTGLYTLSLFLFAPVWGRLSDRFGRRIILLIGLLGFSATMLTFAFIDGLGAIYAERFLSGMFAAAVTPIALATIGDIAATKAARARRLTFVSLAGITGFLVGPMLGVFLSRGVKVLFPALGGIGALTIPLIGTAGLASLAALAAVRTVPKATMSSGGSRGEPIAPESDKWLVPRLLALAFVVSAGVGVFEVGLALRGKEQLGLTQYQIATMFTECSLVMLIVQSLVFSPWIKPETTRWLIAPAFAILAGGIFLVPHASTFTLMLAVIGAVAASAGILSPILTFWISSKAGRAQGAQLGKQTAAASLGAAFGSAAGGLLFDVSWLPDASFAIAAALSVAAVLLSLRLPKLLVAHGARQKTEPPAANSPRPRHSPVLGSRPPVPRTST